MNNRPLEQQLDFSIVSPKLTIEAMRDSGYKSTDHALAELIDNSIDAGSNLIEIITLEEPPDSSKRYARPRVSKIAVADNGEGMDSTTLRRALKFGDGTRLDRSKRGIGRFGVGLPQSSISQCQRVDIWTWQNGVNNALHCFLDLNEIKNEGRHNVPKPVQDPVPDQWQTILENATEPSGTVVVWSQLDRVRWSGGAKTLERTAELCGRVYRKFLTDDRNMVSINLKLVSDEDDSFAVKEEEECRPNDPLYLMSPSSTPAPFQDRPMFQMFNERTWSVPVKDDKGDIHVRCTMTKKDAINETESKIDWPKSFAKSGKAPWGIHADRNKGVSIVRAKRELEMSLAWVNNYEPEERWWSVEVEFDPILDEIFGVVNNKQHAHRFVNGAGVSEEEMKYPDETIGQFRERLEEDADPRFYLLEVWTHIDEQIKRMRIERKKMMQGTGKPRHPQTGDEIEDTATKIINEQKEQGETGDSDNAPQKDRDEKIDDIIDSVKQVRVSEEIAREWAEQIVDSGRRILLKSVNLGHQDAFFGVESVNDVIEVWLNERHPVHKHLIEILADKSEEQSLEEAVTCRKTAEFALRMLFIAWARYEDKAPTGMKGTLEDMRMDWGREARKFLDVIES
ncbi:MAG: ATP-binding protein [Gammaproteobacteria bacterium]|nr:ATP-binding protein [Gammaproteobacteria bacterium]